MRARLQNQSEWGHVHDSPNSTQLDRMSWNDRVERDMFLPIDGEGQLVCKADVVLFFNVHGDKFQRVLYTGVLVDLRDMMLVVDGQVLDIMHRDELGVTRLRDGSGIFLGSLYKLSPTLIRFELGEGLEPKG